MQNDGRTNVIPGRAKREPGISRFPDAQLRICGLVLTHHPGMTQSGFLEWADRKIAQPQVRIAAFFPDPEERPVQRLPQQVVALAHGDADALAEITALD